MILASNGGAIVTEQLQAIEKTLSVIGTMISIFGPFVCCMLFFIFTILVFKK